MTSKMWWGSCALLGLICVAPTDAREQDRRPHRWWQSVEVQTLADLSEKQSVALDKIYRQALPKQRDSMRRLNAEQRILSQLVADIDVQEIDVTRQVDRVEAARSELSKSRLLMVFRMHRILTQAQHDALDKWIKQKPDKDRRSHPPGKNR